MAAYAGLAVDAGARIVGGCCGTKPAHRGGDAPRARRAIGRARGRASKRSSRRSARWSPRPPPSRPRARAGAARGSGERQGQEPRREPRGVRRRALRAGASAIRAPAERPSLVAAEGIVDFEVGAGQAGERLDRFLGHAAGERRLALSRTRLKALIEAGQVAVDGVETRDPAAKLAEGAKIAVVAPPAEESDARRARISRSTSCSRTITSSSSTSPPASSSIPRPDIPRAPWSTR